MYVCRVSHSRTGEVNQALLHLFTPVSDLICAARGPLLYSSAIQLELMPNEEKHYSVQNSSNPTGMANSVRGRLFRRLERAREHAESRDAETIAW